MPDNQYIVGSPFYQDTFWDDLRFPAAAINPVGLGGAAGLSTTGNFLATLLFDASAIEICAGVAQMPHNWKKGTAIHPHIHWTPTTTNVGDVLWQLDYQIAAINGTFSDSYTTLQVTNSTGGVNNKHFLCEFASINMSAFTGVSAMIMWKISRIANDGADTYTGDARLLEFDFHYEIDKPGSFTEYA